MIDIGEIKEYVKLEIKDFEKSFRMSLKSDVSLLDKITHYIVKRKGKQIRPMFVFLSAKLFDKSLNNSSYTAASLIELLHTATLVHDDVVDEAKYRRGFFSINALWKNKIAVLVGDYLLSQGLLLAIRQKEYYLLDKVSEAVKQMSEGELLQIEKSRLLNTTEEDYYNIIRQKTASLVASCCSVGAYSTSKNEEIAAKMWEFGELVGLAFQIKDDLLDFEDSKITGKVRGIDLKEKKLTLPVIYTLNNSSEKERKKIIKTIKKGKISTEEINFVFQKIQETGGIEYAETQMRRFVERSFEILDSLPITEETKYLTGLVEYTIYRKR